MTVKRYSTTTFNQKFVQHPSPPSPKVPKKLGDSEIRERGLKNFLFGLEGGWWGERGMGGN